MTQLETALLAIDRLRCNHLAAAEAKRLTGLAATATFELVVVEGCEFALEALAPLLGVEPAAVLSRLAALRRDQGRPNLMLVQRRAEC